MRNVEKIKTEVAPIQDRSIGSDGKNENLIIENKNKEKASRKEKIIQEILGMKRKAETEPDAINIHLRNLANPGADDVELKNIEENLLRAYLEEEDYNAYENVEKGTWNENHGDFKNYMETVLAWKRNEKMDSGANPKLLALSPKLLARRDFAAMVRSIILDREAERKNKERELKKQF
jgi:hypothetical protein